MALDLLCQSGGCASASRVTLVRAGMTLIFGELVFNGVRFPTDTLAQ